MVGVTDFGLDVPKIRGAGGTPFLPLAPMRFVLPTSGLNLPCAMPKITGICAVTTQPAYSVYRICGSGKSSQFGRRATDVKTGNAGPKLHWLLWQKSCFPALTRVRYLIADIKGHGGDLWALTRLFLAYCL